MLNRVEIKNYRGFQSYRMEGLSQVNLLVGKNNSGKTALLEGIQFLTSGGDPTVLAEVAERRGEVIIGRPDHHTSFVDVAHFFYGHALGPDSSFSLAGDNGYLPVTVNAFAVKDGRAKSEETRLKRTNSTGFALKISRPSKPEKDERVFQISRDGGVDLELVLRHFRGSFRRNQRPQVRFIGPDSLDTIDLAPMWDEVTLKGQEADVAEAMRVLEENLVLQR